MTTYTDGYNLAHSDMRRFGILHAIDKAEVLDGPVGSGYNDAVEKLLIEHVTPKDRRNGF